LWLPASAHSVDVSLIKTQRGPPWDLRCVSRIPNLVRDRVWTELLHLIDGRLAFGRHIARILRERSGSTQDNEHAG